MKRFLIGTVTMMVACLFVSPTVLAEETYRLGVITALSGEAANIGEGVKNGAQLAYDELPADIQEKIQLTFEDDQFRVANTITAYHRLRRGDQKANVILSLASGAGNALAPITEREQVTLVSISSDRNVSNGRKFAFNFWVTPEDEAVVAKAEAERRGYRRIVRINSMQDGQLAISRAFDQAIADSEIRVVLDEDYPTEVKDFKPFIIKLKALQDVDAIFTTLLPGQVGLFAKQVRQLGVTLPLFGIDVFEDKNEVAISDGALLGQWYVINEDPTEGFRTKYTKRYPEAPILFAANAHDVVLLIAEAVRKGVPPGKFNQFLAEVKDFSGALGSFSSRGDQRFNLPVVAKVVTDQGFKKLSEVERE